MKLPLVPAAFVTLSLSTTFSFAAEPTVSQRLYAKKTEFMAATADRPKMVMTRLAGVTDARMRIGKSIETPDGAGKSSWFSFGKFAFQRNVIKTPNGTKKAMNIEYPWGQTSTSASDERKVDSNGTMTRVQHQERSTQRTTPFRKVDTTAESSKQVRVEADGTTTTAVMHAERTKGHSKDGRYSDGDNVKIVVGESLHQPGEKNLDAQVRTFGTKTGMDGSVETGGRVDIKYGLVYKSHGKSTDVGGFKSLQAQQRAFAEATRP